ATEVELRHAEQSLLLHNRISLCSGRHRFTSPFHIHPRRNTYTRRRKRKLRIPYCEQGRQRKPSAGRITGNNNVGRFNVLREQPAICCRRIIDSGGKWMLWSQAVI